MLLVGLRYFFRCGVPVRFGASSAVPVILLHFVKVDLLFIIRGVRKLQNSLELLMERIISCGGARLLRMYIVVYSRASSRSVIPDKTSVSTFKARQSSSLYVIKRWR